MFANEVLVDRASFNDVIGDVVKDHQIGLRLEHHGNVGQFEAAVFEGRQHDNFHMGLAQAPVGDPAPENRVHLGHVRAPEYKGVGCFYVVVAAHRLIHAKGAHEAHHRRCHAMAGIGVDVVAAKASLHQLVGGVAFPHRPLTGTEHAD
ncbi:hypothetical protein D3C87_1698090 [compost metagenome]